MNAVTMRAARYAAFCAACLMMGWLNGVAALDLESPPSLSLNIDARPAQPAAKPANQPPSWTKAELAAAKARCTQVLAGLPVVAVHETPMRSGKCGAPAPVRLISVGSAPQVVFSPPALVTCEMAAALHRWVDNDLQPLARKHLRSEVIMIETMSDYSCRNAYGRTMARLSEHGRANALDIRRFVTAKADAVAILSHWGPTTRDAIAHKAAVAAKTSPAPSPAVPIVASKPAAPPTAADATFASATVDAASAFSLLDSAGNTMQPPSRLGGPAPAKADAFRPPMPPIAQRAPSLPLTNFLKAAHTSACGVFSTVLGPESDNAHRNHLHLDLADRTTGPWCQ